MNIPPRPWRVIESRQVPTGGGTLAWTTERAAVRDANGRSVVYLDDYVHDGGVGRETADLIVRLVNAEPEIVAALEAASFALNPARHDAEALALKYVRVALARLKS